MTRSVNGARPVVKPEGIYLSGDAAAALSHPLRDDRSYGGDSEPIGPRIENMRIRGTPAKTTMQCNGWMEGLTDLFIGGVSLHSPHMHARAYLCLGSDFLLSQ